MAINVAGNPLVFDLAAQGEGVANKDAWMRRGTFTTTFASDLVNFTAHGWVTGHGPIRVEEGNSDLPAGLAESTDYYVIYSTDDAFQVATTRANATAGTAVTISDDGTTDNYILIRPVWQVPIFVKTILIESGAAGGTFEVTESSGGRTLTGALSLAANSHEQIVVDEYVRGVYMTSMADGQILVYHGE